MDNKKKLYGFNNLTKSLSFNIYDVCYAKTPREQSDYIAYIGENYNSERIASIMSTLTDMIGAKVLNVSKQDYDPQGASVTFLIAEGSLLPAGGDTVVAHLDKSHVTVHTYPEYHPETSIATFRVDIDVATCGEITPLSTLDYLIGSFDSDIITMDYRVRASQEHERREALHRPPDHLHTGLYRQGDAAPLRRCGYQCLSGQFIPHENADQGDRSAKLSVQHGCL
jgi:S-adenosylmethionine decarboxylase